MATTKQLTAWVPRAWDVLLDLVYPPRCGGCDRRGTLMCDDCRSSVRLYEAGSHDFGHIQGLICGGLFTGPLREAIHKLKYESDTPLAKPLALILSDALARDARWVAEDGEPPVLVPVPLHPSKKRARGYNQAELLAKELGKLTGWEVRQELVRLRATRSQVGLEAEARLANVRDAFEWPGEDAPNRILLIDDVCTTGATLIECAFALTSKGSEHIYAATVARALGDSPSADS